MALRADIVTALNNWAAAEVTAINAAGGGRKARSIQSITELNAVESEFHPAETTYDQVFDKTEARLRRVGDGAADPGAVSGRL